MQLIQNITCSVKFALNKNYFNELTFRFINVEVAYSITSVIKLFLKKSLFEWSQLQDHLK